MTKDEITAQQNLIRDRYAQDKVARNKAINDIAEDLGRIMRRHLDLWTRNCVNCLHFSPGNEICELAGKRPPARVIAFGCEFYEDQIPF